MEIASSEYVPPLRPVLPPTGTIFALKVMANFTTLDTSSVEAGRTTHKGSKLY